MNHHIVRKFTLYTRLLGALLIISVFSHTAMGFMRVAGGELTLRTSASVSYGDRVNGFRSSPSDFYYIFTTGLGYQGNTKGQTQINATIDAPLVRFSDESQNDSNNLRFGIDVSRPYASNSKISYDWDVSYDDSIEVDYIVNDRVNQKRIGASFLVKYQLGQKIHLRSGINYDDSSTNSYSDNESFAYRFGVGLNDFLWGRVGGYVDYQIRDRQRTGGIINDNVNDEDGSFVFGLTGQILPERLFPKLEADLSVGIQSTDSFQGPQRDTTTINGRLSYPATPKTNISFNAIRDLSITLDDRNILNSRFTLSATHSLRQNLSWTSSISHTETEFINDVREDETFSIQSQLSYRFASPLTVSGSIIYRSNDSNNAQSDFDGTTFTIRASYVY